MATPWDAHTYDRSSEPQQTWGATVLARLSGIAVDARVLDVGCGTGRVAQELLALVPEGRVLAIDASRDMVNLARKRLDGIAEVWCQNVLELDLAEPVDAIVSTATLHWCSATTVFGSESVVRCDPAACSRRSVEERATR